MVKIVVEFALIQQAQHKLASLLAMNMHFTSSEVEKVQTNLVSHRPSPRKFKPKQVLFVRSPESQNLFRFAPSEVPTAQTCFDSLRRKLRQRKIIFWIKINLFYKKIAVSLRD
ncbi:hypothetical protein A0O34_01555 [Chryseobacterium glaciei]|uniref:Uncharacterized protein n=1 Tax=Chryseobacterium glaciei TaxID=1685010 RepID=A0A172XQM5_9FLAO|nr:hypothetical protein [Chryseobacterium glaciei]ANF49319.1 hypothetical protein A0O34_01555 [Chryseobacterium glaciei]